MVRYGNEPINDKYISTISPLEVGTNCIKDMDGKQLAEGIFVIGNINWVAGEKWVCLANVFGMLCVIQVSLKRLDKNEE